MRRVVVTGMGIVSSIGNNANEVLASLREAKSGVSLAQDFIDHGYRCQVAGAPTLAPTHDTSSAVGGGGGPAVFTPGGGEGACPRPLGKEASASLGSGRGAMLVTAGILLSRVFGLVRQRLRVKYSSL